MPIQAVEKEIGGVRYRIAPLGAIEGRGILLILGRLIGAGLSGAEPDIAKIAREATAADLDVICSAFERKTELLLVDQAKQNGVKARWLPFMSAATFDEHFAGRYLEMCEWIGAHVEVNYRGFFSGLLARLPRMGQAMASSLSSSPPPSTGTSGESSPVSESA